MDTKAMKDLMPGVLLTVAVAITAKIAHFWLPGLGSVTLALLFGIISGNFFPPGKKFSSGIRFSEKSILAFAIMLMGLELQLQDLFALGPVSALIIIPTVFVTIGSALLLGRYFGYSPGFSLIMGVGNAVCGSSAIAAVAPSSGAKEDEIGISIGIVNLLGTVGMLLLPLAAVKLGLSAISSSFLLGGSIQAVGQVVSAGFSLGSETGEMATLIKMFRVLLIIPVAILVPVIFRSRTTPLRSKGRSLIPNYLIGFLVACALVTAFDGDHRVFSTFRHIGKWTLMVAMAGIGLKIHFASLLKQAPKALAFGITIVTAQLTALSLLIFFLA